MDDNEIRIISGFEAFVAEFKGESDRATVILTAARLDTMLFSILHKHFLPCSGSHDDLFENQGPAATFANRIALVHRLGLINDEFARNLHLVRRLRNDVAHETSACSLEKGSHRDRVDAITGPYRRVPLFPRFKGMFFTGVSDSRADYSTIVGIMILRLSFLLEEISQVDSTRAWRVITTKMMDPQVVAVIGKQSAPEPGRSAT